MTLPALIARLEKATGPDRELDADIYLASGAFAERHPTIRFEGDELRRFVQWLATDSRTVPHYTGSIDAAVMLVPEGLHWSLNSRGVARVGGAANEYTLKGSEHSVPALALTIASLKARQATTFMIRMFGKCLTS